MKSCKTCRYNASGACTFLKSSYPCHVMRTYPGLCYVERRGVDKAPRFYEKKISAEHIDVQSTGTTRAR